MMALTLYAALSIFLVYSWVLGGIHWLLMVIIGAIVTGQGIILAENLRRRATKIGWTPYSSLCFWANAAVVAFMLYIIVVC
jgi:hypothetical protein